MSGAGYLRYGRNRLVSSAVELGTVYPSRLVIAAQFSATDSGVSLGSKNPGASPMKISATRPPPTENTRPVASHDSWARYVTSGATNSGPSLPPIDPSRSSVMRVAASGAIAFALMLYLAPSTAGTLVN